MRWLRLLFNAHYITDIPKYIFGIGIFPISVLSFVHPLCSRREICTHRRLFVYSPFIFPGVRMKFVKSEPISLHNGGMLQGWQHPTENLKKESKEMKKNRLIALLLVFSMLLAFTACGGTSESVAPTDTSEVSSPEAAASEPAAEVPAEQPEAEPVEAEASVVEEVPAEPEYVVEYPLDTDVSLTILGKLEFMMQNLISDFGEVMAMQQYMEDTGVPVTFNMLGDSVFDDQLNLLIAANDLPDLVQSGMAGYASKLSTAIEEEILIDIMPLLPEYAPDYYQYIKNDPTFASSVTNEDGTTSMFAGVGIPVIDSGLYVRGDWMDELGLDEPETISDLTEIMRAFKSEYDTGMTLLVTNELSSGLETVFNTTANGFFALSMQLTAPGSGEVVAGVASEGYFEYLTYLRELYAEGLINDDFTSCSKQLGTYNSTYWTGSCGVWNEGNRCIDPAEYSNSNDPDYQPRAIKLVTTDDGEGTHVLGLPSTVGRGSMYVTAACENPEIAVSFMNYAYTEAGINLCSFGIEGVTYERISQDEVKYTEMMTNDPNGYMEMQTEILYLVSNWMPTVQTQAMFNLKNSVPEVKAAAELWTANCGDDSMELPTAVTLSAEETETVYALATDVLTLFSTDACAYVMGTLDEAGFEKTMENAMDMGLTEITEIYQAAYDAYMAKG